MTRWWRIPQWVRGLQFDEAPIPVLLPEPLASEVRALLARGERVEAVRLVRQRTHLNLLPAVLAVDAMGPECS
ncbi:hypothetical protein BD833_104175 [Blastococcus xanthinilyticus]|uniref:Uncharacterized protein n=1 Tax=Blastococcus xanthinilyticus TaxID=1564164 RepID=A0A5S5CXE4_9ACTN|nr:hypothetical protein BD833_104175 [Blastococcus xanthinilyticus]